ncbi:PDZ domain-containing protein [Lysobacter xanthus]
MHVRPSLLAIALLGAVAFAAAAQSAGNPAKEKELEAARAELQAAAKRVAALSRELGTPGAGIFVFEERALQKPSLGVVLVPDPEQGVRIAGVTPGSGAAKAGLRAADRITGIDGKPVQGATADARVDALRSTLSGLKAGAPVDVDYERAGRRSTVKVVPQDASPVTLFGGDGSEHIAEGDVRFLRDAAGRPSMEAKRFTYRPGPGQQVVIERRDATGKMIEHRVMPPMVGELSELPGIAPGVHREIIRIARDGACKDGERCERMALAEAFRWNGLNLASIDAQLGRYFGTDDGVLVVSAGPDLAGLQSGDVIRKVDGRTVESPRDVMDVLRAKPEGTQVAVDYLRDRKPGSAQVKVPKAMRIPLPPMAPPPPPPPAPGAPPPPPAPPMGVAPVAPAAPFAVALAPPPPPAPRVD